MTFAINLCCYTNWSVYSEGESLSIFCESLVLRNIVAGHHILVVGGLVVVSS